jgi:hypothetical protein
VDSYNRARTEGRGWNSWVNLSWIASFIVVMIDEKSNQGILAELEDPKIFVICYKR